MIRDFLRRTLIYGLVLSINVAPWLAAGLASPALDEIAGALPDVEPEGEPWGEARWVPIAAVADLGGDDPLVEVLDTHADDAPRVEPTRPADGPAGGSSGTGGPAVAALAGDGPTAGDGAGEGTVKGDGQGSHGARPKAARKSKGSTRVCDRPHPNVHPNADGTVDIDRALVETYTKNLESFMKLGYSHPYDENGVEGWYISGFGCSSPVAKAGFKRGDVLLSVNGKKTRSWVGVFVLYQKLKHKDDFEVQLVRKGAPVTLRFRVVG